MNSCGCTGAVRCRVTIRMFFRVEGNISLSLVPLRGMKLWRSSVRCLEKKQLCFQIYSTELFTLFTHLFTLVRITSHPRALTDDSIRNHHPLPRFHPVMKEHP